MNPSIFFIISGIAAGIGFAMRGKKDLTSNENRSKNKNDSGNNSDSQSKNERKKGGATDAEKANVSSDGGADNAGTVGNSSTSDDGGEQDPAKID